MINLREFHIVYAAQAEFLKKSGHRDAAIQAYQRAIELAKQQPEIRYLQKQLAAM